MPKLKDGTHSFDRRMDRIVQFDEQSREYPVRTTQRRPWMSCFRHQKYWNFRPRRQEPLNQGREGACVGFAIAHWRMARPVVQPTSEAQARLFYHEAQRIDPWEGGSYPGASPIYEGTSVLAGMQVLMHAGMVTEYRWSFGLSDLVYGVRKVGPAVLGLNWTAGMLSPDRYGFIRPSGTLIGGHAILCVGVDTREKYFVLVNSWGQDWHPHHGRSNGLLPGHCYVTFQHMESMLHDQGEAVFPIAKATP